MDMLSFTNEGFNLRYKAMNIRRSCWSLVLLCLVSCFGVSPAVAQERLGVQRKEYEFGNRYLVVEILDDVLAHFELAENRTGPDPNQGIWVTPMVDREGYKNYQGPMKDGFSANGEVIATNEMKISVDQDARCVSIFDNARGVSLTRICGEDLDRGTKRLRIERQDMQNVYGVGNLFYDPTAADGDWVGRDWEGRNHGNFRFGFYRTDVGLGSDQFHGGGPSVSQFPVVYVTGPKVNEKGFQNYALLLDQVYRLSWDFRDNETWYAKMWGDQLRWFIMTGPDLMDLRKDFMELVGRPAVPPKNVFGLWISEFGYDNWNEVREDLDSLALNRFPVDGVALDLQWFGGSFDQNEGDDNCEPNRMGTLEFDQRNFPNPEKEIPNFLNKYGVRFMTIEESYVDNRLPVHKELTENKLLARITEQGNDPVVVTRDLRNEGEDNHCVWWGRGGMIDWSSPAAGKYWHQQKRLKLGLMGINSHWLDLGEPEMYYEHAFYHGFPELGKRQHGDIHNLYNLFWSESIQRGYEDQENRELLKNALGLHEAPRHFTLMRAGTIGSHRYGGMWSGDTAQNMGNLRAHLNTQMHMSMAGMDYYSSDAGGFLPTDTGAEPGHDNQELYTQWFANNSLLDIPLRPHAWAYDESRGNLHFAPDQRGHRESNRANLLQRYELTPYVYALAYRAHLFGEPIFPPLVYQFQDDPNARRIGNVKLIGDSLLFGVVAGFGQTDRKVYLPKGRWVNYHSHEWFDSNGEETPEIPVYRDLRGKQGLFTLPLFARAGAIIPQMYVDDKTRNLLGKRDVDLAALSEEERQVEITRTTELRVKVFAANPLTSFTLYEDDGLTVAYRKGEFRETLISQQAEGVKVRVTIHQAKGTFKDAPQSRGYAVELIVDDREGTGVQVNGQDLPRITAEEFEAGKRGWHNAGYNLIRARSAPGPVSQPQEFTLQLSARLPARTSIHFVCSNCKTVFGEAVFALGNIPELGAWDPAKAVRLTPTRYDTWYRWSGTVFTLPPNAEVQWKFIKRRETGGPVLQWEMPGMQNHVIRTPASGFAGTARGSFVE